ncbi:MAG: hypothetical protein AAB627_01045 [Patescibacteria group bacterium]
MNHKTLSNWGVAAGFVGIVLFVLALVVFWADTLWFGFDHKDFYFGGIGLLAIAIWFKLGAIYHK